MSSRTIGYARVSTSHQDVESQVAALKEAGCDLVFSEVVSTRKKEKDRPQLQAALNCLIEGDELVCHSLSRVGRTQVEVINRLHDLQENKVHVRTLDGLISTRALGKMAPILVGLLTGLNEVERELIRERTIESIEHRRKTGQSIGGRPRTSKQREKLVLDLRDQGDSYRQIRDKTSMGYHTIRRIILEAEAVA